MDEMQMPSRLHEGASGLGQVHLHLVGFTVGLIILVQLPGKPYIQFTKSQWT